MYDVVAGGKGMKKSPIFLCHFLVLNALLKSGRSNRDED